MQKHRFKLSYFIYAISCTSSTKYSVLKNLENRKHLLIKHCKVYLEKVLLVTPSNWTWRTWLNISYRQKLIMIRNTLKLRWSWSRQIWNINTCALWKILNITWSYIYLTSFISNNFFFDDESIALYIRLETIWIHLSSMFECVAM